jgi:hypothetical protein
MRIKLELTRPQTEIIYLALEGFTTPKGRTKSTQNVAEKIIQALKINTEPDPNLIPLPFKELIK